MNFKLPKKHKGYTKTKWKSRGLLWTSEEEFYEIYKRYITSTHCELCEKQYKSNFDRHMDHEHCIDEKWGWFRNVVCSSCNQLRSDNKIRSNNTSGYKGICKHICKKYKQGFIWDFNARVNGTQKHIKASVDLDKLIIFADKWKIDNKYYT